MNNFSRHICPRARLAGLLGLVAAAVLLGSPAAPRPAGAHPHDTPPPDLALAGQVGGRLAAHAVGAGRVYVAAGPRIVVYDVADVAAPARLGESEPLPGIPTHLALEGARVYAAVPGAGLFTIDAGDPRAPTIVGRLPNIGDAMTGLAVHIGYAYVADALLGLQVIDVNNPATPRLLAVLDFKIEPGAREPMRIERIVQSGNDLLVAAHEFPTGDGALVFLSVANPNRVAEVSRVRFGGARTLGAAWIGNHAYLAVHDRLLVFDLGDLDSPRQVGEVVTAPVFSPLGVHGAPGRLYVPALDGRESVVAIFDLVDPARPLEMGRYGDGPWGAIALAGRYIYNLTAAAVGIHEIRPTAAPERRGTIAEVGPVAGVVADRSHAYVLAEGSLSTVRLGDPPRVIHRLPWPWPAAGLDRAGDTLVAAAADAGLRMIAIGGPEGPREIPGLAVGAGEHALDVVARGDRAYLRVWATGGGGAGTDALWVVDLAAPGGPRRAGAAPLTLDQGAFGAMAAADRAVLIGSNTTLVAIDVGDAAAPFEAGRTVVPGPIRSMAAGAGNVIYVGTDNGVQAFDATDPARLRAVGSLATGGTAPQSWRAVRGLTASRDRLYAYLAFPPGRVEFPGAAPLPGIGPQGHTATVRAFAIGAGGTLGVGEDLDLAGARPAAGSLAIGGRYVLVAGGDAGLHAVRRNSGFGAFADVLLPLVLQSERLPLPHAVLGEVAGAPAAPNGGAAGQHGG